MKKALAGLVLLNLLAVSCSFLFLQRDPHTITRTLEFGGRTREYHVHVPPTAPRGAALPVVLVFHGGGGHGIQMEAESKFSLLSDQEEFIAVYPEGIDRRWNDGRDGVNATAHRENIDDIGFIAAMLDQLAKEYTIDPKRIYSTGISNGALFSNYLAANHADRIAAIAPVVGGLAENFKDRFKPAGPVSVLVLQGTDDPLIPYAGGDVAFKRGRILSTDETVRLWVDRDGCSKEPVTDTLPDADPHDGCTVRRSTWSQGTGGTEVVLYTIDGGGHTWPNGSQYLPKGIIGTVCRDFDGTRTIWEFFKKHPKP